MTVVYHVCRFVGCSGPNVDMVMVVGLGLMCCCTRCVGDWKMASFIRIHDVVLVRYTKREQNIVRDDRNIILHPCPVLLWR